MPKEPNKGRVIPFPATKMDNEQQSGLTDLEKLLQAGHTEYLGTIAKDGKKYECYRSFEGEEVTIIFNAIE